MSLELIRSRVSALLQGDKVIWLIVTLMALVSVLVVYSSSEALALRQGEETERFLVKHLVLLVGGLTMMYACHLVNFMRYARMSTLLMAMVVPLLLYTLVLGVEINDARRWIRIPFVGITFQTSDLAKIVLIMYVARTIALMQERAVSLSELIMPVLVVCGLIAPADLSTALSIFFTCVLLMFIGKVSLRDVLSLFMLGVGLFACLVALEDYFPSIRVDTWAARLRDFAAGVSDDSNDQVLQAKMAIAKGGFFGMGPGNGTQAHFLPNAYSDYIYCIIIEEYGIIGAAAVLALYLMLLVRCIRLVTRSPKTFGAMLAIGFCFSIVVQAFIHMAVNVNLVPVTGLTLPFMSMGGTSLMFTGIALGIILSVSRYIETTAEAEGH